MLSHFDAARPRSVVAWALLVGVIAGLSAASYHAIVTEPLIDDAIAIEDARLAATDSHSDAAEPEQVSRSDQRGAGLFTGYALLGAAYALLLAVAALSLRGAWLDPFRRALVAGTILTGALTVVPWLEYPPNPPGVGDPATAGERQRLYWLLVALTGVILAGAVHLSGRLRSRSWPEARRIAAVAGVVAVVLGAVLVLMPQVTDPIPADVPANLLWRFRVASLSGNLLLWGLLTVGFGVLWAEAGAGARRRALVPATAPTGAASPSASAGEADTQNSMPFSAETPSS